MYLVYINKYIYAVYINNELGDKINDIYWL